MIYTDLRENIKAFLSDVGVAAEKNIISFFSDFAPERPIKVAIKDLRARGFLKEKNGVYTNLAQPGFTSDEIDRRLLVLDCFTSLYKSKDIISIHDAKYPFYLRTFTAPGNNLDYSYADFTIIYQPADMYIILPLLKEEEVEMPPETIRHFAVVLDENTGEKTKEHFNGYFLLSEDNITFYESKA